MLPLYGAFSADCERENYETKGNQKPIFTSVQII